MPKLKPLPKVKRTTKLPKDLREFLATVTEQIKAGDDSALTRSDDLLQLGNLLIRCIGKRAHRKDLASLDSALLHELRCIRD